MNKTVQKLLTLSIVASLLSACGGTVTNAGGTDTAPDPTTSVPFNQQQTERLRGTWSFSHPSATPSSMTFTLDSDVEEDSDYPDEYNIYGTADGSDYVIAWYDPEFQDFALLAGKGTLGYFYAFEFSGENRVSGHYEQYDADTLEIVNSYAFTGTRSSANIQTVSAQSISEHDAARARKIYQALRSKQ